MKDEVTGSFKSRPLRFDESLLHIYRTLSGGREPNQIRKQAASKAYSVLIPVIKVAFSPIRRKLITQSMDQPYLTLWNIVCTRLGRGYGFKEANTWHEWDAFFGFDPNDRVGIFQDFKKRIIGAMKKQVAYQVVGVEGQETRRVVSLYQAIYQSKEARDTAGAVRLMALFDTSDKYADLLRKDEPVSNLVDNLLNSLISDEHDGGVFQLFQEACDFKGLLRYLKPVRSIDFGDRVLLLDPSFPKGDNEKMVINDSCKPLLMSFVAKSLDKLPKNDEGIPCLSIGFRQPIDMSLCRLNQNQTLVLSATGSFELPDCIIPKPGQIIVLGTPLEYIKVPEGFSLVSPIDSKTLNEWYSGKRFYREYSNNPDFDPSRLLYADIPVDNYIFLDQLNLDNILTRILGDSIVIKHAQRRIPWQWYQALLRFCWNRTLPMSHLYKHDIPGPLNFSHEFYTSNGLHIRPLPKILFKKRVLVDPDSFSPPSYVEHPHFIRHGFHVIDELGWRVLKIELSADLHCSFRMNADNSLVAPKAHLDFDGYVDFRNMHPETMMSIPSRTLDPTPIGVDQYYRRSLGRDYQKKRWVWLAVLTLGMSRLICLIQHTIRQKLIDRLPGEHRPEVRAILAPFKWRPITHRARDYLHWRFDQLGAVRAMSPTSRAILFGCLPREGKEAYFNSMRYCPLFGTDRELRRIGRYVFRGTNKEKDQKIEELKAAISHVTPWMEGDKDLSDEDKYQKDLSMMRRLLEIVVRVMRHRHLAKRFVYDITRPENIYFMELIGSISETIKSKLEESVANKKSHWNRWKVRNFEGEMVAPFFIYTIITRIVRGSVHCANHGSQAHWSRGVYHKPKDERFELFLLLSRLIPHLTKHNKKATGKYRGMSGIDYLLELQNEARAASKLKRKAPRGECDVRREVLRIKN